MVASRVLDGREVEMEQRMVKKMVGVFEVGR